MNKLKYETQKFIYIAYFDCYGHLNYEEIDAEKEHDFYPEYNSELLPVEPCEYEFFRDYYGEKRLKITFYTTYERIFETDKHGDFHIDEYKKVLTSEPDKKYLKNKLLCGGE